MKIRRKQLEEIIEEEVAKMALPSTGGGDPHDKMHRLADKIERSVLEAVDSDVYSEMLSGGGGVSDRDSFGRSSSLLVKVDDIDYIVELKFKIADS